jgi:hypothetical protein
MLIENPHLLAVLVAYHHERLAEAATGTRQAERPKPRLRRRRP